MSTMICLQDLLNGDDAEAFVEGLLGLENNSNSHANDADDSVALMSEITWSRSCDLNRAICKTGPNISRVRS